MLNIQRAYQTATLMSLEVNYLEFLILNYLISVSSSCIVDKKNTLFLYGKNALFKFVGIQNKYVSKCWSCQYLHIFLSYLINFL